ncbi:hypothetical protein [Brevibacillus brevis]|uniref:deoxynucleotide monophosphate kinase family protein n=1 Tax=Brevibacillus brevis TaxID=1393 RepID=UPI00165DE65F|nr:hypothetical protein [Brevibacillus brevis]
MSVKIALTARARAGKDAAAAHLTQQYGFVRFAFGDGIRKVCSELFPERFANDRKPRALLQGVGQAMRVFDPDVWVNATMRDIRTLLYFTPYYKDFDNIVITDLRQPNEISRLRAEGFVVIRVKCDEATRRQRMLDAGDTFDERDLTHETELHSDGFAVDYEIVNNGSLAELHAKVDAVMAEIMAKGSDA